VPSSFEQVCYLNAGIDNSSQGFPWSCGDNSLGLNSVKRLVTVIAVAKLG
jgi:hypothetical protein